MIEYNVDIKTIDSINIDIFEEDNWKRVIKGLLREVKYQIKLINHTEEVINDCYSGDKVKQNISKKNMKK
ncbi:MULTISPECIES: hypothetical protein [Enterococcus]|uniref:Uncharacterized protein n=1 Tax=Enterococcus casseliflavus TaxID=37734 RepID=A0ABD6Z027_ENTCA|nr:MULTISPECIES: hypothetical protein [Enterococcus]ATF72668.1 hypothetical protein CO692_11500 [Enterococcus sp. FDAARGOS_375]AYJ46802.1 hypothetical protein D8N35_17555 [Enterococcus casseliflavus]MBF0012383.1 hypothetical protein [Enterococcus casseliflavus]MBX9117691.1 hypothetical protein [Enterococcus casseliflavus]MCD5162130.1 hypothetical protein [Enterococcus casseliflavus]